METFLRTTTTGDAFCAVNAMVIFVEEMGAMGADSRAIATLNALVGKKRQLRLLLTAFRIVTPTAS